MGKNIVDKIWERHVVHREEGKPDLLYVDLHLIHEVTSPQAFSGLRMKNRKVRRPDKTFATMDHNVPTINRNVVEDEVALNQMKTLEKNCAEFGIELAGIDSPYQGIVHVIGPELGLTQPGKIIVCGDSHTSLTALSARSLLESEQAKWSMCWRHKRFGKQNRRR